MIPDILASEFLGHDLSLAVKRVEISVLRSPIEVPVQTSFGTMHDRPALFLKITDMDGNFGLGEVWCNFPGCGANHRARLLETAILPALVGRNFSDPAACYHSLQKQFERLAVQAGEPGPIAQCIAGIDIALWDLVAKRSSLPLYRLFGGSDPEIGVYASGINPVAAVERARSCQEAGYRAMKLKIGFGADVDFNNIEGICGLLKSGERMMVDANQAWHLDEARHFAQHLSGYPIGWLEEPIMANAPISVWQDLATSVRIHLAGGENISDLRGFNDAIRGDWLSVIQPDLCKWGGFSAVVPVAKQIVAAGKRFCPHFLGGGLGLAASAHLLAAVGGNGLLEVDSNPNPLRELLYDPEVSDGYIRLSEEPGLGIDPNRLVSLQNNQNIIREQ